MTPTKWVIGGVVVLGAIAFMVARLKSSGTSASTTSSTASTTYLIPQADVSVTTNPAANGGLQGTGAPAAVLSPMLGNQQVGPGQAAEWGDQGGFFYTPIATPAYTPTALGTPSGYL